MKFIINNFRVGIVGSLFLIAAFFSFVQPALALDSIDTDSDGLTDEQEIFYHTDPNNADTDNDGYGDYQEIFHGYSPRQAEPIKLSSLDSDNDGAPDSWEIRLGLDLLNPDTDGDGYSDGTEILNSYNPLTSEPQKQTKEIKVDLASQQLSYYFGGQELEKFLISGGVKSMPTPKGEFSVMHKVPEKTYGGTGFNFYYSKTKWNLHFTTAYWKYYIHGAYWHNNFGRPMSHGCVNVPYDKMERLYEFSEVGTRIEIS
ncbi:MAG: hypothetical protein A2729_01280 [Candidatus Buchananbacteria bacterium RIFCSPHIGHO2_01_FULL_39_14]|uniref:L,D-TPase catalytic domain-containing protein n=2 Tax=Candidatus Buchananiibacteriota TaxID=1817903 RepID=A0A1G1YU36_9BACT|nr:MAG: hypothetical protein A2729_01280 [Candidatus Buchananbacteria bacterium RIFCSPHIGHO2_01_FULL_39_14]OGY49196.1 MAG: hypothetical protein A3D39_00305 [Candidatus Buchananbacteria bacterium RIFCSPHIGHO2_02_FULL_39_17]OGY55878.1 MAG: hypothetical protein A2912_02740 [Candidatus Buchananbacteria bacterium RIFCSPLOWO2_01_FULL_40_23b]